MIKKLIIAVILALCLFGGGCGKSGTESGIRVFVENGDHYNIEVNMVEISQGDQASFYIDTESGYNVIETDYDGEYTLTETRGLTKLVLEGVNYPTRVKLKLSFNTRIITYDANGGEAITNEGKEITRKYDVSYHIRPNVSIGTDLFEREGYILTGWNTAADGSGTEVGLGSRMTVDDRITLYAQWIKWSKDESFSYEIDDNKVTITGVKAYDKTIVIPEKIGTATVEVIAAGAFRDCPAQKVYMPKSITIIEEGAFVNAALNELHLYDNIEFISDKSFVECNDFSTFCISAIEDPYGFSARRESVWADKLDVMMTTMGESRVIFYGGCSAWYNLIGTEAQKWLGDDYKVLNMGLNGVVSSVLQMEILKNFVTDSDILVHTPEISSIQQLMLTTGLYTNDTKLWCGLEYNYDLVKLLDVQTFEKGFFDSFNEYLGKKEEGGAYTDIYHDSKGREYLDETLSIPYVREEPLESLADSVSLNPVYLSDISRLEQEYREFLDKGVTIYVSYAAVDIDKVPEEEREWLDEMGKLYNDSFNAMDGVEVISDIHDFVYHDEDFYDTVYHLLTEPARNCTYIWIRDLKEALETKK